MFSALPGCGQNKSATNVDSGYDRLLRTLYRSEVPTIQPAELVELRRRTPRLVVLDTRTPAEYQVSHLQAARFVDYDQFDPATLRDVPRDQPVVVYCSVGARSQTIGEKLQKLGFRDVRNLYGGIFQWVNEGQPVYDAKGPTSRVHPYSALWGIWLKKGEKAYE
ncbi:hypothetical protein GCM10023186_33740 [Hymenobacter koreensis]|uniref:Rhodanese domain-containing protein n=1 Tax=Hymenobacter koreensis TaxID=1084523 RepID=A0ABP8JAJ0_9BACT